MDTMIIKLEAVDPADPQPGDRIISYDPMDLFDTVREVKPTSDYEITVRMEDEAKGIIIETDDYDPEHRRPVWKLT